MELHFLYKELNVQVTTSWSYKKKMGNDKGRPEKLFLAALNVTKSGREVLWTVIVNSHNPWKVTGYKHLRDLEFDNFNNFNSNLKNYTFCLNRPWVVLIMSLLPVGLQETVTVMWNLEIESIIWLDKRIRLIEFFIELIELIDPFPAVTWKYLQWFFLWFYKKREKNRYMSL